MPDSIAKTSPSMDDVARAAGVSKATVSLALRGAPSIPARTRERVQAAVTELGYRLNPFVSSLMSHKRTRLGAGPTMTIGYLTSHPASDDWRNYPAYLVFRSAAEVRARQLDCRIDEFAIGRDGVSPGRLREVLRSRSITGVIVAPLPGGQTDFPLELTNFSAVGLGLSVHEPRIEQVATDHFDGAVRAVRQCYQLGYRRIALAVSEEMSVRLEDRWVAGYRLAMNEAGLRTAQLEYRPKHTRGFSSGLNRWARRAKPDVVLFGTYDESCWAALPREIGLAILAVPEFSEGFSGIAADWTAIARTAVDHLLLQMRHHTVGPLNERRRYLICSPWVAGRTALGPKHRRPEQAFL